MSQISPKWRLMRLHELTSVVPYSPQHIRRLEQANQFPQRVRIGANRVGWVREEVEQWLSNRIGGRFMIDEHNQQAPTPCDCESFVFSQKGGAK